MTTKQNFTIVIFSENRIGLVNRITSLFIQRHINIESFTASESEYKGIHRFTIVVEDTAEQIRKIAGQIEKQVEVLKAYYFTDEDTIFCEVALYKIKKSEEMDSPLLHSIIEEHGAAIKEVIGEFIVIEKSGTKQETHLLFEALRVFDIQGFVRSGRISLSKTYSTFANYLKDMEKRSKETVLIR